MYLVSVASRLGNLQMVKKVVVTKSKFNEYMDEIQQSYELGFTPYRLYKNQYGIYIIPIRVYDESVYVLENVATMNVSSWYLEAGSSKLICFVKGVGGIGIALQGDRGASGSRGLKGDSGGQVSVGSQGPAGKRGIEGPEGPLGKVGKMGHVGSKGDIGTCGERGDKGDTDGVGQQVTVGPRGSTVYQSVPDCVNTYS